MHTRVEVLLLHSMRNALLMKLVQHELKGPEVFLLLNTKLGDPVENAIVLSTASQIVLVEGNYLLLDEQPWVRLKDEVFDDTWYLDIPIDECCRRVFERHLKTGLIAKEAKLRVDTNDRLNARQVAATAPVRANRIIRVETRTRRTIFIF